MEQAIIEYKGWSEALKVLVDTVKKGMDRGQSLNQVIKTLSEGFYYNPRIRPHSYLHGTTHVLCVAANMRLTDSHYMTYELDR